MGISAMFKLLQEKEKKIVLVKIGNFYVAGGKDAVLLSKLLDLKLSCLETGICKVGFPIKSIEKYTKEIEKKDYSYVVYNYESKENNLEIAKQYIGNGQNKETRERANCLTCKGVRAYPKTDRYVMAVAKLYEKDEAKEREKKNKEKINEEQKRKRKIWFQKKNEQIN